MVKPFSARLNQRIERAVFEEEGKFECHILCPDCGTRMVLRAFVSSQSRRVLVEFQCPNHRDLSWDYHPAEGMISALVPKEKA